MDLMKACLVCKENQKGITAWKILDNKCHRAKQAFMQRTEE